jgi:hypothetical protein
MHFVLGFLTGPPIWPSILTILYIKGWEFPAGSEGQTLAYMVS